MTPTLHEAVLIGPAAAPLGALLPALLGAVRLRTHPDPYAAAADLVAVPPASIWVDAGLLGSEDLGGLQMLRRLLPAARLVVIVGPQASAPVVEAAVALGCVAIAAPLARREVAFVLRTPPPAAAEPGTRLVAGLADCFNNALATLVARLQLAAIAVRDHDQPGLRDNLALARHAAGRMSGLIDKLAALSRRKRPILRPVPLATVLGGWPEVAGDAAVEAVADEEMLADALAKTLAVANDLAGGRCRLQVLDPAPEDREVVLRIAFDSPRPHPCPDGDLLEPFRLSNVLSDADLGLDLPVAAALLAAQNGRLEARVETGLLQGFDAFLERVMPPPPER